MEKNKDIAALVADVLIETDGMPIFYIADKIVSEVLSKELQKVRDHYERLFYTDTSTKN